MRKSKRAATEQRGQTTGGPKPVEIRYTFRAVPSDGDNPILFDVLALRLGAGFDLRVTLRNEAEQLPGDVFRQILAALETVRGRVTPEDLAENED